MTVHLTGKTHKGILKRLKITGTGKIIRKKGGKSHLLSNKTGKRLRRLRATATVPKHLTRNIMRALIK